LEAQIKIVSDDVAKSKALAVFGLRYLSFLPKRSAFSSL